jgi:hypothetical protein
MDGTIGYRPRMQSYEHESTKTKTCQDLFGESLIVLQLDEHNIQMAFISDLDEKDLVYTIYKNVSHNFSLSRVVYDYERKAYEAKVKRLNYVKAHLDDPYLEREFDAYLYRSKLGRYNKRHD